MTERIYYLDSLARAFDATVTRVEPADEGGARVALDRTAFYPTSGGQPFDTGRLGGSRVTAVEEDEAGDVWHVLARSETPLQVGAAVSGDIDWPRRFDHMQQHTGQHILSAAFDRSAGVRTVSFHLGADASTIDLAREVTETEIARAESDANAVVFDDREVGIRFASEEEAARLPLRKEPVRRGRLRLVEIPDCDLSACGGTHVPRTGMVGLVAIAAWERYKGASRITFVCGGRAQRSHGDLRDVVARATRTLSISAADLPPSIERLLAESKEAGRAMRRLETEVAESRAARFRADAPTVGGRRCVLRAMPGWDATALKALAAAIVSEPGFVVVLVGDGQPAPVVVARSSDVNFDAGGWMKRATAELGGRGGGKPDLAQGGLGASAERVLTFALGSMQ
jgi:alanyl-tRNA synthetase